MFHGHFRALVRLNGPNRLQMQCGEVKYETAFRYAHAWIGSQMVENCGYRLDHGEPTLK